jgi:fucose permease
MYRTRIQYGGPGAGCRPCLEGVPKSAPTDAGLVVAAMVDSRRVSDAAVATCSDHEVGLDDDPSSLRQWQIRSSLTYYATIWFLGLQSGIIGPSLGALATRVGAGAATALAPQFFFRSAGFLTGTLLVGLAWDVVTHQHRMYSLATALLAAQLAVLPMLHAREAMFALWVPIGVCMGFVDTGSSLLIMLTWKGGNVMSWMNFLHFCWGVGSMSSPVLLTFFSAPASFCVIAAAGLVCATLPVLLSSPVQRHPACIAERELALQAKQQTAESVSRGQQTDTADRNAVGAHKDDGAYLVPTAAAFGIWLFYVGIEAGYGSWLATFLVDMDITDDRGAAIATSTYWGALTLGRLLAVPLALVLSPGQMIGADMVGALLSCAFFLVVASGPTQMLICAVGIGLSLASVFASTVALATSRMPFTGRRASFCIAGASVGQVTLPYLIGELFRIYGAQCFPAVCLVLVTCLLGCYLALVLQPVYTAPSSKDAHELGMGEVDEERQGLIAAASVESTGE